MSIEKTASSLNAALRAFGESLGRSLAEGIALGVQEGLARSLELERLALPTATVRAISGPEAPKRRGGRPRSEPKPCRIPDCPDPARSRGLCSRHYQQELRREKAAMAQAIRVATPGAPITARPPIVRKKSEESAAAAETKSAERSEPLPTNPLDAAKRIFG